MTRRSITVLGILLVGCSGSAPTLPPDIPAELTTWHLVRRPLAAQDAMQLARTLFALEGQLTEAEDRFFVADGMRVMQAARDGSFILFHDGARLATAAAAPPGKEAGERAVNDFLARAGIPAEQLQTKASGSRGGGDGAVVGWQVAFAPAPAVAGKLGDGSAVAAPLPDLVDSIAVDGNLQVIAADLAFFGVEAAPAGGPMPATVAARPPPLARVAADFGVPADQMAVHLTYDSNAGTLVPFYVVGPKDVAPEALLLTVHGAPQVVISPASDVAPIAAIRSATAQPMLHDAATPLSLQSDVALGMPPYTVRWWSPQQGLLGTNDALTVTLPPGDHEIHLQATDARGLKSPDVVQLVLVDGEAQGTIRPAPGERVPYTPQTGHGVVGDWSFSYELTADSGIRVFDIENGVRGPTGQIVDGLTSGHTLVEEMTIPQLRYEIHFGFKDTPAEVIFESGACGLSPDGQAGACESPVGVISKLTHDPRLESKGPDKPAGLTAEYRLSQLPGTVRLAYRYLFDVGVACGPGNKLAWPAELVTNQTGAGLVGDACPGFLPEITWGYRPPACIHAQDVINLCAGSNGTWNCTGSKADVEALGTREAMVVNFRLTVFTRFVTLTHNDEQFAVLIDDGDPVGTVGSYSTFYAPLTINDTMGAKRCDLRDAHVATLGAAVVGSDMFCQVEPMEQEAIVKLASEDGYRGAGVFDNVHIKARFGPSIDPAALFHESGTITDPGCNDPFNVLDKNICFHIHETWPAHETMNLSRQQNVSAIFARYNPGETRPADPRKIADGEKLWDLADPASQKLVFWHVSEASAQLCSPRYSGTPRVKPDNWQDPCHVLASPVFVTGLARTTHGEHTDVALDWTPGAEGYLDGDDPNQGQKSCADACTEGQFCPGQIGKMCCGGKCIDVTQDDKNCGSCGTECKSDPTACPDGCCYYGFEFKCCQSTCAPIYNDSTNCGSCGQKCSTATPNCDDGACSPDYMPDTVPLGSHCNNSTDCQGGSYHNGSNRCGCDYICHTEEEWLTLTCVCR